MLRLTNVLLVALMASDAMAQDEDEVPAEEVVPFEELDAGPPELEIIQNRKYEHGAEVAFAVGVFPADPFYKGLSATGGFTWHMSDHFAWEMASFTWSFNFDSKLKEEVQRIALSTGSTPPEFPAIQWMAASRLVLKPLYGKEAWFNTDVVHLEAFLHIGPAVVSRVDTEQNFGYGLDLGGGLRLWLTRAMSMRLDIGELVYILPESSNEPFRVKQALHLHLGIAFNLRSED